VLHRVAEILRPQRLPADVDEIGAAVIALRGSAAPTTWNRNRAAVGSWLGWCTVVPRWSGPAFPGTCERRREPMDDTRARRGGGG